MKRDRITSDGGQHRKKVVIVMMPSNFMLHVAGPYDVFNTADQVLKEAGSLKGYDLKIVSPTAATGTIHRAGVDMICRQSALQLKGGFDTVLVSGSDLKDVNDPEYEAFYQWLGKLEERRTRRIGSVCGGAFPLAKAGLLNGRRATVHWQLCQRLENTYPMVKVDVNAFHTQDGPIYTSGGVSSGIDLALALVEQDHGKEIALAVARRLVVYLSRPGFQVQFGNLLPVFDNSDLAERLRPWINEHLSEPLDVGRLAGQMHMSPRNFARVFHKQTGLPPAKFIEKFRVEAARKYLEDTDFTIEDIAERCGLGGMVSMRRTFLRNLKTTPSDYRRAFRTSVPEIFAELSA